MNGDGEDAEHSPPLVDVQKEPPRSITKAASEIYGLFDTICDALGEIEGEDAGAAQSAHTALFAESELKLPPISQVGVVRMQRSQVPTTSRTPSSTSSAA